MSKKKELVLPDIKIYYKLEELKLCGSGIGINRSIEQNGVPPPKSFYLK